MRNLVSTDYTTFDIVPCTDSSGYKYSLRFFTMPTSGGHVERSSVMAQANTKEELELLKRAFMGVEAAYRKLQAKANAKAEEMAKKNATPPGLGKLVEQLVSGAPVKKVSTVTSAGMINAIRNAYAMIDAEAMPLPESVGF